MAQSNAPKTRVLVVDDDGEIRGALELLLAYEGYEVWTARDGREALARLEREAAAGAGADVVLCDVKMPGLDGPGVLDALAKMPDAPPVIMVSGHADVATAVDAVRRGARDFIEKPLDQNRVLVSIQAALREDRLAHENTALKRQLDQRWQLVGESAPMVLLREQILRAARADAPVLVTGENGTGKELVARQIHLASARASGPLVTVNCAAIPAELIESELFGHEKGSFTGAHDRRTGHFEAAEGGTLFLDEVGDMPLAAQAKVLRALETFEVTRVGSTQARRVDLRVVAATNADLAQAVEDKAFRLDLFYRLNVVPLRVPALREHPGDIQALCEHFLRRIAERTGRAVFALEDGALEFLRSLDWPGNVRQLRNLLEGACVLADGTSIARADLERILENGPALSSATAAVVDKIGDPFRAASFEEFKDRSEALFFSRQLAERGGNIKRTAEELGMQRSHLYKKLDRYGLR
ncbi:MAG TPA: sigma-54 dependent transcriptional regulator [Planctomycetota bacterium]|nr:sigma-54 dependent transcriptional regulator [Planctomycetota bacterium]